MRPSRDPSFGQYASEFQHPALDGVQEAAGDEGVQLGLFDGGRDNRGQPRAVAVVDDLAKLLLRPRRRGVAAKAIQDEEGSRPHLLEQIAVGDLAGGAVGGAKVVEKVGRVYEEDDAAPLDAAVANGGGDMGLPRSVGSAENEPARQMLGVLDRRLHGVPEQAPALRVAAPSLGVERLEGETGQMTEVAVPLQPAGALLLYAIPLALADDDRAKFRVADGHVGRVPAPAGAALARGAAGVRSRRLVDGAHGATF